MKNTEAEKETPQTDEEKQAIKEQKAAAKKAAKEKAAKDRKEKSAEKKKEKEKEIAQKKLDREANREPEQNEIRKPKPGTLCRQIWDQADSISTKLQQPVPIKDLLANFQSLIDAEKCSVATVKTQYARWRKFHGVTGRVSAPVTETADTKAA